jgi:hypothetical protein
MSGEPDVEIREVVADRHQLPDGSARFLIGDTVDELEASASELAELVGERRESEPIVAPAPTFVDLVAASRARKQQLAALFAGQPARAQPRDQQGRFAAVDFSRGARQSTPPEPPTHEQTLTRLFRSGEANARRSLFDRPGA